MAQLLPEGMRDPFSGSVVEGGDRSISYGETWSFHFGDQCPCGKLYPHLDVYGGRVQRLAGVATLTQWIRFALSIERFRHPIYSHQFGVEFEALVARSPSAEEVQTEAPRLIREALVVDDRVLEVREVRLEEAEADPTSYFVDVEVVSFTAEEIALSSQIRLEV